MLSNAMASEEADCVAMAPRELAQNYMKWPVHGVVVLNYQYNVCSSESVHTKILPYMGQMHKMRMHMQNQMVILFLPSMMPILIGITTNMESQSTGNLCFL